MNFRRCRGIFCVFFVFLFDFLSEFRFCIFSCFFLLLACFFLHKLIFWVKIRNQHIKVIFGQKCNTMSNFFENSLKIFFNSYTILILPQRGHRGLGLSWRSRCVSVGAAPWTTALWDHCGLRSEYELKEIFSEFSEVSGDFLCFLCFSV